MTCAMHGCDDDLRDPHGVPLCDAHWREFKADPGTHLGAFVWSRVPRDEAVMAFLGGNDDVHPSVVREEFAQALGVNVLAMACMERLPKEWDAKERELQTQDLCAGDWHAAFAQGYAMAHHDAASLLGHVYNLMKREQMK